MKFRIGSCIATLFFLMPVHSAFSQCSSYPVPFKERVSRATYIAQGKVSSKHSYLDEATGNINTLNRFVINAWLKNGSDSKEVYVITLGGVVGNKAMLVQPSLQLDLQREYVLLLEADNYNLDDEQLRSAQPAALQLTAFADEQGSLINQGNYYFDKHYAGAKPEIDLFLELNSLTKENAKTPQGLPFIARPVVHSFLNNTGDDNAVTGFFPGTVHAGTVLPEDQVTVEGSGFGSSPGSVYFANANDGGATYAGSNVASDIISWSDNSIVVKTASTAGTGKILVNGIQLSASNLTIPYAHTCINSTFYNFASSTRQRYNLINKNGQGGYSYSFNTDFAANSAAKAAFERSLFIWRCTAGVNLERNTATSALTAIGNDGVNLVFFDATLPAGVLGRATSYFAGNATGACQMENTVWYLNELDMQFRPDPPTAGYTWQYGPSLPTGFQYDFESVASHEIGHHMGLGHVIAPGQLMHYALSNGSSMRSLSSNDLAGVAAKLSYSTAPLCFNPAAVAGPMTAVAPGGCALPVKLADFTGLRKNETANELQWYTLQESNNRGFYIERSHNGVNFSDIGFVNGAGNTTAATPYSYLDNKAGILAFYYRLRQVDADNRMQHSNIVFIEGSNKTAAKIWADETGSTLFLYLNELPLSGSKLSLVNGQGQQVLLKQINQTVNEIDVRFLSKGIYFYRLQQNGQLFTGKALIGK